VSWPRTRDWEGVEVLFWGCLRPAGTEKYVDPDWMRKTGVDESGKKCFNWLGERKSHLLSCAPGDSEFPELNCLRGNETHEKGEPL